MSEAGLAPGVLRARLVVRAFVVADALVFGAALVWAVVHGRHLDLLLVLPLGGPLIAVDAGAWQLDIGDLGTRGFLGLVGVLAVPVFLWGEGGGPASDRSAIVMGGLSVLAIPVFEWARRVVRRHAHIHLGGSAPAGAVPDPNASVRGGFPSGWSGRKRF